MEEEKSSNPSDDKVGDELGEENEDDGRGPLFWAVFFAPFIFALLSPLTGRFFVDILVFAAPVIIMMAAFFVLVTTGRNIILRIIGDGMASAPAFNLSFVALAFIASVALGVALRAQIEQKAVDLFGQAPLALDEPNRDLPPIEDIRERN